jgi:hypothetical protein
MTIRFVATVWFCIGAIITLGVFKPWKHPAPVVQVVERPAPEPLHPMLNPHPSLKEIHGAEVFMAKRCHAELRLLRTYKDSLALITATRTYSSAWPEAITNTTCLRWMLLGDSTDYDGK